MDLAEIRSEIRTQCHLSASDGTFPDATLNAIANTALRRLAQRRRWPWMRLTRTFATVSGTGDYAVAADWSRTLQLWIDDRDPMHPNPSLEPLNHRFGTGTGEPAEFTVVNRRIYVRPVPDQAYTVNEEYLRVETTLADDADTPVLPAEHHDVAVSYMCYLAMRRAKEFEHAAEFLADYREALRDLVRDAARVPARPGVINREDWQWG